MFTLLAASGGHGSLPADTSSQRFEPAIILSKATELVLIWRRRAVTRRQLLALEAFRLADLGLAPDQIRREAAKPFWRA